MSDKDKNIFDADAMQRLNATPSAEELKAALAERFSNPALKRDLIELTTAVLSIYTHFLNKVRRDNGETDSMLIHILFVALTVTHKIYTRNKQKSDFEFIELSMKTIKEIILMNNNMDLKSFLHKYLSISMDDLEQLKAICKELESKVPGGKKQ